MNTSTRLPSPAGARDSGPDPHATRLMTATLLPLAAVCILFLALHVHHEFQELNETAIAAVRMLNADMRLVRNDVLVAMEALKPPPEPHPNQVSPNQLPPVLLALLQTWPEAMFELYDGNGAPILSMTGPHLGPPLSLPIRRRGLVQAASSTALMADYVSTEGSLHLFASRTFLSGSPSVPVGSAILSIPVNKAFLDNFQNLHTVQLLMFWNTPPQYVTTIEQGSSITLPNVWENMHTATNTPSAASICTLGDSRYVYSNMLLNSAAGPPVATISAALPFLPFIRTTIFEVLSILSLLLLYLLLLRRLAGTLNRTYTRAAYNGAALLRTVAPGALQPTTAEGSTAENLLYAEFNAMIDRLTQMEAQNRLVHLKYQTLFENSVAGLFITSPDGRLLDANQALISMFGYDDRDDILKEGRNVTTEAYARPAKREELKQQLAAHGKVKSFKAEFFRKDKTIFTGLISVAHFIDQGGELIYEGSVIDISEQQKIQNTVCSQMVLESTEQVRSDLLDQIGREIMRPSNIMAAGCVELLQERPHEDRRRIVDNVRNAAQSLQAFAGDLLDYARISSGKMFLNESECNMRDLLHSILPPPQPSEQEGCVMLDLAPDLPEYVVTDKVRLRQLFLALYAVFFPAGEACNAQLSVSRAPQPPAQPGTGAPRTWTASILFSLHRSLPLPGERSSMTADNDHRRHSPLPLQLGLYESFNTLFKGTILGHPMTSATASFILPFAIPAADESKDRAALYGVPEETTAERTTPDAGSGTQPTPSPLPSHTTEEALIITADIDEARLLGLHLTELQITHYTVNSAEEALSRLRTHTPRIVLIDIEHLDTNGLKTAERIHTLLAEAVPPPTVFPMLIAVTEHSQSMMEPQITKAGMHAILTRPLTHTKLHDAIAQTAARNTDDSPSALPHPTETKTDSPSLTSPDQSAMHVLGRIELMRRAASPEKSQSFERMLAPFEEAIARSEDAHAAALLAGLQAHHARQAWPQVLKDLELLETRFTAERRPE